MHKAIIPFLSIFMLTGYILKPYQKTFLTGEQTTVADVLRELGEAPPKHYIAEVDTAKVIGFVCNYCVGWRRHHQKRVHY